jgi:hypothetical protein
MDDYTVLDDVESCLVGISSVNKYSTMEESLQNLYHTNSERRISATIMDVPSQRTFISKSRHSSVTVEEISERWSIGLAQSRQTLRVTTQKGIRSVILPLSR